MAKETIIGFVQATIDRASRTYVPPEARIATFEGFLRPGLLI